jgi:transposase
MTLQNNKLDFSNQHFYVGLDVHKKTWAVTIRSMGLELKRFSTEANPKVLYDYMQKNYPNGNYFSVYESGFCGYWIHRQLESYGFKNIVVNPAEVPTSGKEKLEKLDPIDSRKLARELENRSIKGIYIPNMLQQEIRSLCRLRYQQIKKQTRLKNQIKSYLNFYGHKLLENSQMQHWSRRFIEYLKTKDPALTAAFNGYIKRMSKQQAVIRIAKKLLSRINYILNNKKPYVCSVVA